MKIKFQLILKKEVHPEHYLLSKLYPLAQAEGGGLVDFDTSLESVKSWINVEYYTAYDTVPNRKLLGFTIDVPIDEELDISKKRLLAAQIRRLIDTPVQSLSPNTSCFAVDLQKDTQIVEAVLRYEDDFILEYYKTVQPEIFLIEMRLREVLNYILSYTLPQNDINSFLQEFDGPTIPNESLRTKQTLNRKSRSEKYYENELFWILFTSYGFIRADKQKLPKAEDVFVKMQFANSFEDLKNFFYKITFTELDEHYNSFLNQVYEWLKPIEKMRNEIMHTRKPTVENEQEYEKSKIELLDAIDEFWQNELSKLPQVETIKKYLLDSLINRTSFEFIENDNVKFQDLNFEIQELWEDEAKTTIFNQISEILNLKYSYSFSEDDERVFYEEIDRRFIEIK